MENKTTYTAEEDLAIAVDGALYLLKKADELTGALYALACLLEGKTDLDQTQIGGIRSLLLASQVAYDGEAQEHHESVEFLAAYKKEQFALSAKRHHAKAAT